MKTDNKEMKSNRGAVLIVMLLFMIIVWMIVDPDLKREDKTNDTVSSKGFFNIQRNFTDPERGYISTTTILPTTTVSLTTTSTVPATTTTSTTTSGSTSMTFPPAGEFSWLK